MLHDELIGQWTPERIHAGLSPEAETELCKLLNRLNTPRDVHVAKVDLLKFKTQIVVTFGDGSGITLGVEKGIEFLAKLLTQNQEYMTIMEYNRADDPRKTGEFDRLQRIETRADQARQIVQDWKDCLTTDELGIYVRYSEEDFVRLSKLLEDRS